MIRQINHKTMRGIIGIIAIALSPIAFYLSGSDKPLTSISISYWTDSHDIFVGSLIIVGFFLSSYNGQGKNLDWEYYLSRVAGICAVVVAIFPTDNFKGVISDPPYWVSGITELIGLTPKHFHYGGAFLLFGCLIGMMYFFSIRAAGKKNYIRSYIYKGISITMVVGMAGIFVLGKYVLNLETTTLWVEAWGLTFFGIGWFVAGIYKEPLEPEANK